MICGCLFNLIFILLEHDVESLFCPVFPLLEHSRCLPLWLWPHPQPHGQQDRRGSRDHIGQPVGPPHCCGCQREGGTYHCLPGRLQGEPAQGKMLFESTDRLSGYILVCHYFEFRPSLGQAFGITHITVTPVPAHMAVNPAERPAACWLMFMILIAFAFLKKHLKQCSIIRHKKKCVLNWMSFFIVKGFILEHL